MSITGELASARKALSWTQGELAQRAGLSRMTVQRTEAGDIDPRLSTLLEMARALGMGLMMVPDDLRLELEAFLRSGGTQANGVAAHQTHVARRAQDFARRRFERPCSPDDEFELPAAAGHDPDGRPRGRAGCPSRRNSGRGTALAHGARPGRARAGVRRVSGRGRRIASRANSSM